MSEQIWGIGMIAGTLIVGFITVIVRLRSASTDTGPGAPAHGNETTREERFAKFRNEAMLDESIREAKKDLMDQFAGDQAPEGSVWKHTAKTVAMQNSLTAYEAACAACLEGTIDMARFRKRYQRDLARMMENPLVAERILAEETKYPSIRAVYQSWQAS